MMMPGFSSELTLSVTYDEDTRDWQDGSERDFDVSRNFMIDCSKEKAQEILGDLIDRRFFWYERYPEFYKAQWKKRPGSFYSRIRRKIYRVWLKNRCR